MRNIVSPLEGIRSPFGPRYGGFSPASLFAAGEQGVWYDPSDFSTMFQDAAGTTPVTAVEQPVRLLLDKSQGLAIGGEIVTNGDFSNGTTGWTGTSSAVLSNPSGALVVTYNAVANPGTQGSGAIVAGAWYIVSYTVTAMTNGTIALYVGSSNAGGATNLTAPGTKSVYIQATNTTPINIVGFGNTGSFTIDNVSVKRIAGNHATQSTNGAQPTLSARVNLLTYSEQFNNAAWTKAISGGVTITANATTAPDGTSTADLAVPDAVSGFHAIRQAGSTPGGACTFSVYYKPNGYTKIGIREDYVVGQFASFDCSGSGSVLSKTAAATASITALANGWYYLTFNNTSTGANQGVAFYILSAGYATGDPPGYIYTGDGTSGGYIWGADLRSSTAGATLPAYQRIAAATDYDTTGFPYYLKFDGTDDSMATGTITPGIDKAQVFAGVRKQSDAAVAVIVEHSATTNSFNGAFVVYAPSSPGASDYFLGSKGTLGIGIDTPNTFAAPITNVYGGLLDIAAPLATLRLNGVQSATTSATQGTGNFLAYPLYIGRRGGTTLPFNGNLYSLIVRFGSNLDATTISNTETYVNGKTLAY